VFRLLSNDPANPDAMMFIANALLMICVGHSLSACEEGGQSTIQNKMLLALRNTLRSVLITLSAMCLLNSTYKKSIMSLTENILVDNSLMSLELDRNQIVLIAMTHLLAGSGIDESADRPIPLLEVLRRDSPGFSAGQCAKEDLPAFVCDVAHCLARGTSNKPFEHLKIIIEHMEACASTDTAGGGLVLRQIIRDCAFAFAQHQPEQEHFKYAEQFGRHWQSIPAQSKVSLGICQSPSDTKFRWEEGISEWVTATPRSKPGKDRWIRRSVFSNKVGYKCSPNPISKRGKDVTKISLTCRVFRSPRISHSRVADLGPPSPSVGIEATKMPSQQGDARSVVVGCLRLHSPPQISPNFSKYTRSRRGVNKLQRLGKELLRSNQDWRLFSDSDDELSITNPGTVQRPSENLMIPKEFINKIEKRASTSIHRSSISSDVTLPGETVDELGL
jgi:hypothetical protein